MIKAHLSKLIALFTLVSFMLLQPGLHFALSDELNPGLYSANSDPYGIPFSTWTGIWWQWYLQIPDSVHPFGDSTGKYCGANQTGPVWYLAGSKGPVERSCEIPSDKAIFFPVLNTEFSYLELPTAKTDQDLRNSAINGNQQATLKASIDGREIKDIDKYRVTSGLFNVTYAQDNVFGLKLDPNQDHTSQAVSDGWFLMLEPLKPGKHLLKFSSSQIGSEDTAMDVTYNIMSK